MGKTQNARSISSIELASFAGVRLSTIHYYTVIGLLQSDRRTGNRRLYPARKAKARMRKIAYLRRAGYSLTLIRKLLVERNRQASDDQIPYRS